MTEKKKSPTSDKRSANKLEWLTTSVLLRRVLTAMEESVDRVWRKQRRVWRGLKGLLRLLIRAALWNWVKIDLNLCVRWIIVVSVEIKLNLMLWILSEHRWMIHT